jgi:hypothetical protein
LVDYDVLLHRGGKDGELLVTGIPKRLPRRISFHFPDGTKFTMTHTAILGFRWKNKFCYLGQSYVWRSYKTLRREDGTLLAHFKRSHFALRKMGTLEVYEGGEDVIDVIVATFMMLLYREEKAESTVEIATADDITEMIIPCVETELN